MYRYDRARHRPVPAPRNLYDGRLGALLLILPLALDTFAVSAAIGASGMPARARTRISLVFAGFETAMPLAGLAAGSAVGGIAAGLADAVAIALLAIVGAGMLLQREDGDEGARARRAGEIGGVALAALGLSVSLDELAIGFTIGLLGVPVLPAVALIGIQAFAAAQLGLRLGARLGDEIGERAERLSGVALLALAAALLAYSII